METIDKIAWLYVKDRKVLFLRSRGKETFYAPGGKREEEESDIEALVREIQEEVNVKLLEDTIKYMATFKAQAHGKPEGVHVEMKCYSSEYEGELTPSNEIEEMDWFTSADEYRATEPGKLILKWLKEKDFID